MSSSKHWNREAGPKPTKKLLNKASKYATPASDDHMVVAMAFRPNGVTQTEVIKLFGHPHRNKIRQLVRDKRVRQTTLPEPTRSVRVRLVPLH